MHPVIPLGKLALLMIKQISKPISNFIKDHAKDHPIFRRYVCIPPAKLYYWCEVRWKMWILGLGKPVRIEILKETEAIEMGSSILGDATIFFIMATGVVMEASKSARNSAKSLEDKRIDKEKLKMIVHVLHQESINHEKAIQQLGNLLAQVIKLPGVKESVHVPNNVLKLLESGSFGKESYLEERLKVLEKDLFYQQ